MTALILEVLWETARFVFLLAVGCSVCFVSVILLLDWLRGRERRHVVGPAHPYDRDADEGLFVQLAREEADEILALRSQLREIRQLPEAVGR